MNTFRTILFCTLLLALIPLDVAHAQILSQRQQDRVMAMQFVLEHPNEAKRLAAVVTGVEYESNRQRSPDVRDLNRIRDLTIGDPFSEATWKTVFDPDAQTIRTRDDYLKSTADRIMQETGDPRKSEIYTRTNLALNLGVAGAGLLGPEAGAAAGAGKAIFDYGTDSGFDEMAKRRGVFTTPQDQLIDTLTDAEDNIRNHSDAGKAYSPAFHELWTGYDPEHPGSTKPPAILTVESDIQSAKSEKGSEQMLIRVGNLNESVTELNQSLRGLQNYFKDGDEQDGAVKQAKEEQQKNLDRSAAKLQDYRGGLMLAGYAIQLGGGDPKAARFAFGLADMADKVSLLISKAPSPMMLAAGWVGVGLMAVDLLQSAHDDQSPYPQIFALLTQISRQLNDLKDEMRTTLGRMDNRLGNLLLADMVILDTANFNAEQIRQQLTEIQGQLSDAQQILMSQNTALAEMFMSDQDAQCIRVNNGRLQKPKDFLFCQNVYQHRAIDVARDPIQNQKLVGLNGEFYGSEGVGPFPFASRLQSLAQALGFANPELIVNPAVWSASVGRYLALIESFPSYLASIDLSTDASGPFSNFLDPILREGERVRSFIQSLAFKATGSGTAFNSDPIRKGIQALADAYTTTINATAQELVKTTLWSAIDITKSSEQQNLSGVNFNYAFLSPGAVDWCQGDDWTPVYDGLVAGLRRKYSASEHIVDVSDVVQISEALPGGEHGSRVFPKQSFSWFDGVKPWGPLLTAEIAGIPAIKYFQPDPSIQSAIAPLLRVYEPVMRDHGLTVCLDRVGIGQLDIENSGFSANVYVEYKISVGSVLAERLSGNILVHGPYFNYVHDGGPDPMALVSQVSEQLRGQYGAFLKGELEDSPDVVTIRNNVDGRISDESDSVLKRMKNKDRSDALERARSNLIMLASVGLNTGNAKVDEFSRRLRDATLFPSDDAFVDRIMNKSRPLQDEADKMHSNIGGLGQLVGEMEKTPVGELYPNTVVLDARINQLKALKEMRIRLLKIKGGTAPR